MLSPGCASFVWPAAASCVESVAGLVSDIGMLCSLKVVKDIGPPTRTDLLFYQRQSLALPFGNAPGQAAHLKAVLAQHPANAAGMLADLVRHNHDFTPVRLQL